MTRALRCASLLLAFSLGGIATADPTPDDAAARELLARWVSAQNRGAFAEYESLYAPDFRGVRRSGDRVVPLARAAWMKERAAMFRRPLNVSASKVRVEVVDGRPSLIFQQEFASAGAEEVSYADVGEKRLWLERVASKLSIVREEMLSSKRSEASLLEAEDTSPAKATFAQVLEGELVLEPSAAELDKAKVGPLALREKTLDMRVRGRLLSAAPEAASAYLGKRVRVFDLHHEVCLAEVTSALSIIAMDHNLFDLGGDSAAVVASRIWKDRAHELVAKLHPLHGDCSEGVFARREDAPGVVRLAKPAPTATARKLLAAYRALPRHRALQAKAEAQGEHGPWDALTAAAPRLLGEHGLAYVGVNTMDCEGGSFQSNLWALFDGNDAPALVTASNDPMIRYYDLVPFAVIELEGDTTVLVHGEIDGAGRFFVELGALHKIGSLYRLVERYGYPVEFCHC